MHAHTYRCSHVHAYRCSCTCACIGNARVHIYVCVHVVDEGGLLMHVHALGIMCMRLYVVAEVVHYSFYPVIVPVDARVRPACFIVLKRATISCKIIFIFFIKKY